MEGDYENIRYIQGEFNGQSYLLTFCAVCNAGAGMDPIIDGKIYHFRHSNPRLYLQKSWVFVQLYIMVGQHKLWDYRLLLKDCVVGKLLTEDR